MARRALEGRTGHGRVMTYAANLGRDRIIRIFHGLGATDFESAAPLRYIWPRRPTTRERAG